MSTRRTVFATAIARNTEASSMSELNASVLPAVLLPINGLLSGVNGWLKFFVIVNLYVSPVFFVLLSIVAWISFAIIAGDYPAIIPVGMIETGVGGFLVWKWIQIARGLRDIRPGIVQEAKTWLQIVLAWNLFSLSLVYLSGLDAEDLVVGSLRQAVQAVTGFTIWYSYFNVSKRVKATYPDWKG